MSEITPEFQRKIERANRVGCLGQVFFGLIRLIEKLSVNWRIESPLQKRANAAARDSNLKARIRENINR